MPRYLANVRCVNYLGAGLTNGYDIWGSYNGPTVTAHFQAAKALGFNTVRVNLPAILPGATNAGFTFPTPQSTELARWTDMQTRAKAAGLKIRPILFNYAGSALSQTANLHTHATAIWGATDPTVISDAGVEANNELAFSDPTRVAGYTSFITDIVPFLRTLTGKPVTSAMADYANLAAFYAAVNGTAGQPDFYDRHWYTPIDTLNGDILTTIALVGAGNLFFGEFGLNATPGSGQTQAQVEAAQRDYIQEFRWRTALAGLPEPAPFDLFDFTPGGNFTTDYSFGLYRADAVTLKPAGQLYLDAPMGQPITTDGFNGQMSGLRIDNVGNTLPQRWNFVQNAYGTANVDTTVLIAGKPTIRLNAGPTPYNSSTPPELQAVVSGPWPKVQQGATYALTITAVGSGSIGTPQLTLLFYGADGTYQGGSAATPFTPTSTPTTVTASAVAPAGAASIRAKITSLNNAGSIWIGNADLTGPPTRTHTSSGRHRRTRANLYNRQLAYTNGAVASLADSTFTAKTTVPAGSVPPAGRFCIPYPDTAGFTPSAWTSAGGTHIRVQAFWDRLQLSQGAALDPTALRALNARISTSVAAGLQVILEIHLAHMPSWLTSSVVPDFKNQNGETYSGDVLDWVWSAAGRTVVADFVGKVLNGVTLSSVSAMLVGGGPLDELHYPSPLGKTPAISFWGYSAPAQTGTGIASGQAVCPLPGYTYVGNGSANDLTWSAWYLGGLRNWMTWLIAQHRAAYSGLMYVMHPDVGIRTTRPLNDTAMIQQVAAGTDWSGQMDAYPDPQVAPWCTWLDSVGTDSTEANQAPWAKLYDLALAKGRAGRISGENAAGTSNAGLTATFAAGGAMPYGYRIYCHVGWDALNAGGSNAALATLQGITATPSAVWALAGSTTPPADTTPPGPVTSVTDTKTSSTVTLSWTNPSDSDFAGVIIRRALGSTAPSSSTTGTAVTTTSGSPTAYTDNTVAAATQYSYALFAKDVTGNIAAAATVTVTTSASSGDTTPPGAVTNYNATPSSARDLSVSWSNPTDTDFAGVQVRYIVGTTNPTLTTGTLISAGAKSVPDDGSAGLSANDTNFQNDVTINGLSINTTYSVGVWAVDSSGNHSTPAFMTVSMPLSETSPNGAPAGGLSVLPNSSNVGWRPVVSSLTTVLTYGVSASGTGWNWDGQWFTSTTNGTSGSPVILSGFDIPGGVTINKNYVTLQRSLIRATGLDYHTLFVASITGSNSFIEDCEIGGGADGVTYICGPNATGLNDDPTNAFLRCNIHHLGDGGKTGNGGLWQDCWWHNLPTDQAAGIHSDGLQWGSGAGAGTTTVLHCTVHGGDYTCLYVEYVGTNGDPTIEKNLLLDNKCRNSGTVAAVSAGHGLGAAGSVLTLTDNIVSPSVVFVQGAFALNDGTSNLSSNGTTIKASGNIDTTGAPVSV